MSASDKINIAKQIEEMQALLSESRTTLPARVRRGEIGQGLADERLGRQEAILRTLEFCRDHEAAIREVVAARGTP